MIRDLIKWGAPGLATVLGGTTLCLAMTSADIATDLTARSTAAIAAAGHDWAELSLSGRDLTVTGTITDQALLDAAVSRLSGLAGIRSVTAAVTLAPLARPYRLEASIADGRIALAGGVPDETTRQRLLLLAGLEQGALDLRSGVPDRRSWVAGAEYAIDQLQYLDQGTVSISDRTISLNGRARSERAFRDLLIVMRAGAPAGLALGEVKITPALVSPYHWSASFDGQRIAISGYVPDDALVERYRTADVSGAAVATGLALGSGEPADFSSLSQTLLEQLARLEQGSASITDGRSMLSGAPATLEIAQGIVDTLEPSGTIVVLEPPRVEDYWMSATRQRSGVVVFDGYVPDEATREAFSQRDGADTSYLKLGRGAPERYRSGADFGLDALELMSEGRVALRDNVLTIVGTARTSADYASLLAIVNQQAPQGLVLARAEILAPLATPYSWTAAKSETGSVTLSGLVPDPAAGSGLVAEAGQGAVSTMTYASGAPDGFLASAATALDLLQWLQTGQVVFDGAGWTVTGVARSDVDKAAIEADFVARQLASAGWSMAVANPLPVVAEISPYTWSATRTADGVSLMGHVPDENLKTDLAARAGVSVVDTTALGAGAPGDFAAAATAGLAAVMALEEGEVSYDGRSWSLNGRAPSEASREATIAALSAATDSTDWSIAIAAPEPERLATVPYVWSATRAVDGAVVISGLVPTEPVQRVLAVRAGDMVTDQSTLDASAPEGFAADQLAAMAALAVLSDGRVGFDGQSWTISGTLRDAAAADDIDAALAAATTPAADWTLSLFEPAQAQAALATAPAAVTEPSPAPSTAPTLPAAVNPDYAFSARRGADAAVLMSGQMPSEPAMRYFAAISSGDVAAVSIADGAPAGFLPSAETGLRALLRLDQGQLDFSSGAWSLRGTAPDAAARDAVLAALDADPGAADWISQVDLPSAPPPVAATAAPGSSTTPPVAPAAADIAACAAPVSEFSARNAILFQSGAALIAAESDAALDELAMDLAACPDAVVYIEGHTDADGDESLNLALSVARAEAVVNALVARGVTPGRLYAAGFGETAPVADNATAEGRQLNRRIVVTVRPEHY